MFNEWSATLLNCVHMTNTTTHINNTNILIPVWSFPVDPLLRDGLDEEGVRGKGVKVDQGGLVSSAAVCDRLPRNLHILEEGDSPAGRAGATSGPG